MIRVPALTLQQLEDRAGRLLSDYAATIGADVPTPVPVVDIALDHLALELECVDLHALLGLPRQGKSPDILGRMLFDEQKIQIDKALEPKENPLQLGRFRFSVGHEIGHWILHRTVLLRRQARLSKPIIVCREPGTTNTLPVVEFQAEEFSSCVLLPRERVNDAWGDRPAVSFSVHSHGSQDLRRIWVDLKADPALARAMFDKECSEWFDNYSGPLAKIFEVSKQAMRSRLNRLGLLRRVKSNTGLAP